MSSPLLYRRCYCLANNLIKSDATIKAAKPKDKLYRLFDGDGLYLLISPDAKNPNGKKWWRLDYAVGGKRKTLSLGIYPSTGLSLARDKAIKARSEAAAGIDPSDVRKADKARQIEVNEEERRLAAGIPLVGSFEAVAREWYSKNSREWVPSHGERIMRRLERDVFPWLGARPIGEIKPPEILAVLRRIEERGAIETAHRAASNCGQVFRYGVATGHLESDPTRDLRGALKAVTPVHMAAITDPGKVGALLRAFDGYKGSLIVCCALQLAPLVFVRPGELRRAEWAHIDFEKKEWRYIVTKTDTGHIVPLAPRAIEILREVQAVTGGGRYVFPSARSGERPMSDNALLMAMRSLGIPKEEMSGHGFRAMARTILDEVLGVDVHLIEHQLCHAVRDPNGRAYNRTKHLPQRHLMMRLWAGYLETLKNGADVIQINDKAAA